MDALENKNLYLRIKTLYANLLDISVAAVMLPLLTFIGLHTHEVILYWWLIYMSGASVFLLKSLRLQKNLADSLPRTKLKSYMTHWSYQTYFFGFMWAALPWTIANPSSNSTLLIAFVIAGVTAGSTISCATFPKISFVYSMLALSSLIFHLIFQNNKVSLILAAEVFLYLILLVKMQRTLFSFFMKTFSTMVELDSANEKIKNSQLIAVSTSRLAAQAEMTANLAHEINNPLAIIQLKTEHLLMLSKQKTPTIDLIQSTCEKNLLMVDRIQTIISSTKKYFYQNQVNEQSDTSSFAEVIDEVSGVFLEKCKNRGILFIHDTPYPCDVNGSRTVILQVITNLLNNAFDEVKHQTDGRIYLQIKKDESEITLSVVDSGKGIAPEMAKKIFEPFYTTKGKGAGLGMGLSICVGLVNQIGGELWVEQGLPTTFKLKIKVAQEQEDTPLLKQAA